MDTRKEMERIISISDLTVEERYDLVVQQCKRLNDKERKILFYECKRNNEGCK